MIFAIIFGALLLLAVGCWAYCEQRCRWRIVVLRNLRTEICALPYRVKTANALLAALAGKYGFTEEVGFIVDFRAVSQMDLKIPLANAETAHVSGYWRPGKAEDVLKVCQRAVSTAAQAVTAVWQVLCESEAAEVKVTRTLASPETVALCIQAHMLADEDLPEGTSDSLLRQLLGIKVIIAKIVTFDGHGIDWREEERELMWHLDQLQCGVRSARRFVRQNELTVEAVRALRLRTQEKIARARQIDDLTGEQLVTVVEAEQEFKAAEQFHSNWLASVNMLERVNVRLRALIESDAT